MAGSWIIGSYEPSHVYRPMIEPATAAGGTRLALPRRMRTPPLPQPAGQRPWRPPFADRGTRWLYGPNGSKYPASVPCRGGGLLMRPLLSSQPPPATAGRYPRRAAARPLAPKPTRVREDHPPLDASAVG